MKKDISNREDIYLLVTTFYKKVRKDKLLGPIFNQSIQDWPEHLDRLTDFWETNLLFVKKFKGNPLQKHQLVDAHQNHSLEALHFGVWLNMWFETLDTLFQGEKANLARNRARNMGNFFYLKIFSSRPSKPSSE